MRRYSLYGVSKPKSQDLLDNATIRAIHADMIIAQLLPFPDIDPILFSFEVFGRTLAIRWYALSYIAAFLLATWWINRLIRDESLWKDNTPPISKPQIDDLLTYSLLCTN